MTHLAATDRELWHRAGQGDLDAFGTIFHRHSRAVHNHLFRRTASWSEAEDLCSAVFLDAWRRRKEVVLTGDSALPWLLGVANHALRNQRRALRRFRAAQARLAAPETTPDPADRVAERLGDEKRMVDVRAALDRLPRHEREVVELCVWSGLDQRAAAVALGVAVGTVKSRLHRARRRLSELVDEPAALVTLAHPATTGPVAEER